MTAKGRTFILAILLLSGFGLQAGQGDHVHPEQEESPVFFSKNIGQWQNHILYEAEIPGGRLYLEPHSFTYDFYDAEGLHDRYLHEGHADGKEKLKCHAFGLSFPGANSEVEISADGKMEEYRNYFLGNDPSRWKGHVPLFQKVIYHELFNGIDLEIYGSDVQLKYDLKLKAGADPAQIQLQYEGLKSLKLTEGNLHLKTSVNELIEQSPIAWQLINGVKVNLKCVFSLRNETVGFEFPNGYDSNYPIVIDPLIFSTYSGSTADNWGFTATYDRAGNYYGGGIVFGTGYPTVFGSYDLTFNGSSTTHDISISKYNPTGTSRIYSTYLGGSSEEQPHSLVVTSSDELLVLGTTNSTDYPTTTASYDASHNGGVDIIVTKFRADGAVLIGSTFVGGGSDDGVNIGAGGTASSLRQNYGDHNRGEIIVNDSNQVFVATCTRSIDFPMAGNPYQNIKSGNQDAVVFKLDADLKNLIWSTYLGGASDDACYGIKLDGNDAPFVTGGTASINFPATSGSLTSTYQGSIDGFIAHFNKQGSTLIAATFLGTSAYDQCYFLEIDDDDDVYVVGQTRGASFPITPGTFSNAGGGQFITKINNALNTIVYSTRFGSGGNNINISPTAFLVDVCEYIYVSGWGGNVNFSGNTNGMPITAATAYQTTTDGSDFYIMVLQTDATALDFATYYGGAGGTGEHVDGGTSRFDKRAAIYQAVCAGCGGSNSFPTTAGSISTTNNSSNCNLGSFKIEFPLPGILADFTLSPTAAGCNPHTINFTNTSLGGTSFSWDFGDATGATTFHAAHTYTTAGTFTVRLVANDPFSCNVWDTAFQQVTILPQPVISVSPDDTLCQGESVSVFAGGGSTYLWSPSTGLGNPTSASTSASPLSTTTYQVLVTNSSGCKDSANVTITVLPPAPVASAGPDTTICPGDSAQLHGAGVGIFLWTPNGSLSNNSIPNPIAKPLGSTTYTLTITDANGCDDTDDITVNVSGINANAGPDQNICVGENTPIVATGGTNYSWTPGTSLSSTIISNPIANPSNSITYYLTVTDGIGCVDYDSVMITVNPLPSVIAWPDTSICYGENVQIFGSGANTYSWSPSLALSDPLIFNPNASPLTTTTYTLTGTDGNECVDIATVTITVLPLPPADAGADLVLCQDSVGILSASGGVAYNWSPSIGLSNPTISTPSTTPQISTTYVVTVTGANGCEDSDDVLVSIIPTPVVNISGDLNVCKGQPITLTAAGAPSYLWSSGETDPVINVIPDTSTIYSVVGYQSGCPSKPVNLTVNVINVFPQADFIPSPDSGWLPLAVNFNNTSQGASSHIWDLGNGITTTQMNPSVTYTDSGRFEVLLIVQNEFGCLDTIRKVIIVVGDFTIIVPNAFTPNSDGLNDEFYITYIGIKDFEILLYDRWGQLIFTSRNADFRWPGTFQGEAVQQEVYTYVIQGESWLGHKFRTAGTVTLYR